MKQAKQRVIAIDYFRGICILMVVINHAAFFTWPLPLLEGDGRLWTSAAEMFFLLSGLTLWIVRGEKILTDFKAIAYKIWRRAASIYLIYIITVLVSLYIALLLSSHNLQIQMTGALPSMNPASLMAGIFNLSYTIGWANFLMFYVAYLLIAPFAMWALKSRWWVFVPLLSLGLYAANSLGLIVPNPYAIFLVWQVYFFLGLSIGRFRPAALRWFFSLKPKLAKPMAAGIVGAACLILAAKLIWAPFVQPWTQAILDKSWLLW